MPASTLPLLGALLAAFSAPQMPAVPAREVRHDIVRLHERVLQVRDVRGRIDVRVHNADLAGGVQALVLERRRWVGALRRMRTIRPLWRTSPRWRAWMCIHSREGAWNDPDAPYFGGLQMDRRFQRTYGADLLKRYGTADRWPLAAQVAVAERAYAHRRFTPWPNTARACDLL